MNEQVFDVVLADPPWKYYGAPDKWAAAAKHYECLDRDAIASHRPTLATPGVLFTWTTSAFLADAIELCRGWGLHYRGVAFVWVKTRRDGTPYGATGVRPSITKPITEFVVAASTRPRGRPLPLADEGIQQTVFAPRREHSRKPSEVMERIERMYPDARKLEMYSREPRHDWTAWGNETGKYQTQPRLRSA